jgi:hypothetical protein
MEVGLMGSMEKRDMELLVGLTTNKKLPLTKSSHWPSMPGPAIRVLEMEKEKKEEKKLITMKF